MLKRLFLYLILFLVILFGLLYVAINSSYVFDKVAGYFAPQYGIHYDKVSGNAWEGITIEGLYYKEKKLAREIKIKLNPATLLEQKITASHLVLHGVNEQYLEAMISDFSDSEEDNSSSNFPFSVRLNDVKLTMLPFTISGIHFAQADLRVESIDYAEDDFAFGTLRLMAKTSLGRADIKGKYYGRDLHLSDLYIGALNTEEIERLFLDDNSTQTEEANGTAEESPSIFIPKKLQVKHFKATVLPRTYQGILLSLLTIDGKELEVDLDQESLLGELAFSLRTNVAKAEIDLLATPDQMRFRKVTINDINVTKILGFVSSEDNSSKGVEKKTTTESNATLKIPFVSDHILLDEVEASLLPMVQADIPVSKTVLKAKALEIDLPHKVIRRGEIGLNAVSQIATVTHQGRIKDNQLKSHVEIVLEDALLSRYHLPLRKGALQKVSIDAMTNKDQVFASMAFSASRLLDADKDAFNLDIKPSLLHVKYLFATGELIGDLESNISTPYTKNTTMHLQFGQKEQFAFKGEVSTGGIDGIDPKFSSLLKDLSVNFDGNLSDLLARIESTKLQGKITLKDFAKGVVHLESKEALAVGELVKLPKALKGTKAKILIDMPIDTNMTFPLHAKAKLLSNVLNMDANVSYDKTISLKAIATVPPKSLLKNLDQNIQFKALSPLQISAMLKGDALQAKLHAKKLKVVADYNLESGATRGDIDLAGTHLKISGASTKALAIKIGSSSIQTLLKAVNSIYKVDLPDVRGGVTLQAEVKDLNSLALTLQSKEIRIGEGKEATRLSNLSLKAKGDEKGVVLERYAVETQGVKLYAKKPSKVVLKGDSVLLSPFWLNDMLKATGEYNLKQKKGKIRAEATALKIDHEMAEIVAALGLDTKINGDKISVSGKVHLKGGTIKYDLNTKSFAADSDIVILQHQHKKNNYFEKNIATEVTVDSSKPLLYKKGDIDIALLPDLKIKKRYGGSLSVHGKVSLLPGGSYRFQGKKFVLKKSSIIFKGKPTAPILNINILYRHAGTTIRVKVSGTASDPSLDFSSDPHMSREEILSFIMFDTGSGGDENSASDVTNLVTGSLVKSLFANMGLKLDHLVLTGSGFEVGKKLSDRITVIYDHKKESFVKIRIQNTKNIETDISFGASSRSADIFYKKEF